MSLADLGCPGGEAELRELLDIAGTGEVGGDTLDTPGAGFDFNTLYDTNVMQNSTLSDTLYFNGMDDDDDDDDDGGGVVGFNESIRNQHNIMIKGPKGNIPCCQRPQDPSRPHGPDEHGILPDNLIIGCIGTVKPMPNGAAGKNINGLSDVCYMCTRCKYTFTVHPAIMVNECSICKEPNQESCTCPTGGYMPHGLNPRPNNRTTVPNKIKRKMVNPVKNAKGESGYKCGICGLLKRDCQDLPGGCISKKTKPGTNSLPLPQSMPSLPLPQSMPSVPLPQSMPSVPLPHSMPSVPLQQSMPSVPLPQSMPSVPLPQSMLSVPLPNSMPSVPLPQSMPSVLSQPARIPPSRGRGRGRGASRGRGAGRGRGRGRNAGSLYFSEDDNSLSSSDDDDSSSDDSTSDDDNEVLNKEAIQNMCSEVYSSGRSIPHNRSVLRNLVKEKFKIKQETDALINQWIDEFLATQVDILAPTPAAAPAAPVAPAQSDALDTTIPEDEEAITTEEESDEDLPGTCDEECGRKGEHVCSNCNNYTICNNCMLGNGYYDPTTQELKCPKCADAPAPAAKVKAKPATKTKRVTKSVIDKAKKAKPATKTKRVTKPVTNKAAKKAKPAIKAVFESSMSVDDLMKVTEPPFICTDKEPCCADTCIIESLEAHRIIVGHFGITDRKRIESVICSYCEKGVHPCCHDLLKTMTMSEIRDDKFEFYCCYDCEMRAKDEVDM